MKVLFFSGFLVLFAMGASACTAAAQIKSSDIPIVGTWRLDGELPPNNTGHGFHWFLEYTFNDDGRFILTGYPPLMQKGKYRIVKVEENKLTVDLYEQSGNFGTKDKQIELTFDKETNLLKIDGKDGFTRQLKAE
jgi:hypothetical protein